MQFIVDKKCDFEISPFSNFVFSNFFVFKMSISFFTNFECENSLKWPQLVDTLEGAMMRFSTGGVIQPVRAMLPVKDYNGWIGNFFD